MYLYVDRVDVEAEIDAAMAIYYSTGKGKLRFTFLKQQRHEKETLNFSCMSE